MSTTSHQFEPPELSEQDRQYLANYNPQQFNNPAVSVDIVIFTVNLAASDLQVLLVKRSQPPYAGYWALPGGFVQPDESLEVAAMRELREEAGVQDVYMEQLFTFGDPARDPRMRVITVTYFALVKNEDLQTPHAGSDASDARWVSVYNLPSLAFDHARILDFGLQRLRSKLEYTNIAFQLVPEKFTLTALQRIYEIILNEKLDKRNFRKRLVILEQEQTAKPGVTYMLEELAETLPGGNFGRTRLYRFIDRVERIIK